MVRCGAVDRKWLEVVKIREVVSFLERKAPPGVAESWDNVGLLIGDSEASTKGAVIAVDLTADALAVARKNGYRLIINHHPAIFPKGRGPSQVLAGSLVHQTIRENVSVFASHTNFDRSALEVAEMISKKLRCSPTGRLLHRPEESLVKLAVYVPESHHARVLEAVCEAGAGQIGHYDSCSFSVAGEGTFRGDEGTDPFTGEPGRLEKVPERLLQTILPKGMEASVVRALKHAHPYEEVAYDLYPLLQSPSGEGLARGLGYGFVAEFDRAVPLAEFLRRVKAVFGVSKIRVTRPPGAARSIRKIAFAAGKGSDFIGAAARQGCDAFITGESDYHDAIGASRKGLALVELGHRESEKFFPLTVASWLKELGLPSVTLDRATQDWV